MNLSVKDTIKLFNYISRSHSYWGRKPINTLSEIFCDTNEDDILWDPFVGGGGTLLIPLLNKAKVIASDLNPISILLTKVLVRPINITTLTNHFEYIKKEVAESINNSYKIKCHTCHCECFIKFTVWKISPKETPIKTRYYCSKCNKNYFLDLNKDEIKNQLSLQNKNIKYWYPKTTINSKRKTKFTYHHELYTLRNLNNLSILFDSINKINTESYRDALFYIFTAMLYSCSKMQMFSQKEPISSRGWTALRYYVPELNKEKNVLTTFESRFKTFIKLKSFTNNIIPEIQITSNIQELEDDKNVFIKESNIFNLNYEFPKNATYIFLDPPYNEDIEYLSMSEFWGNWLRFNFSFNNELKYQKEKFNNFKKQIILLFKKILNEAKDNIIIVFSIGINDSGKIKDLIKSIQDIGFNIDNLRSSDFTYSHKGKVGERKDQYFIIKKSENNAVIHNEIKESVNTKIRLIIEYCKIYNYAFLEKDSKKITNIFKHVLPRVKQIIPATLLPQFTSLKNLPQDSLSVKIVKQRLEKFLNNPLPYNAFVLSIIKIIADHENLKLTYLKNNIFTYITRTKVFSDSISDYNKSVSETEHPDVAFIFENNDLTLLFSFQKQKQYSSNLANKVFKQNKEDYNKLVILIIEPDDDINEYRKIKHANTLKRAFFVSFNKLLEKAYELDHEKFENLTNPLIREDEKKSPSQKIRLFTGKVVNHVNVGGKNSKLHKLRFRSEGLEDIVPGQFIMLKTLPENYKGDKIQCHDYFYNELNILNNQQVSYLKRPFGIHRTFYDNFSNDYLKKMFLPKSLSTIIHSVFPSEYDIFYKVIEGGIGTNELKNIQVGTTIEFIGPLGKRYDLREVGKENYDEVHIIGGGVGMAPLVYFAQALKYFNQNIKAFIGIESLDSLKHKDNYISSFKGDSRNAHIYIDDLQEIGIQQEDIYISFDIDQILEEKSKVNYYNGYISEQYYNYLDDNKIKDKNILAIVCGPNPMMKKLNQYSKEYYIDMKVLMERRMACGFGVCFSCVCKTKSKYKNNYSRVCLDGPLYNSKDIDWDEE